VWSLDRTDPGSQQFFFAAVGDDSHLRQEVFYLGYHLHWAYDDILDLDTVERRHFVRMLSEEIDRQNASLEEARHRR
jgi:uncharacterized protein DUF6760